MGEQHRNRALLDSLTSRCLTKTINWGVKCSVVWVERTGCRWRGATPFLLWYLSENTRYTPAQRAGKVIKDGAWHSNCEKIVETLIELAFLSVPCSCSKGQNTKRMQVILVLLLSLNEWSFRLYMWNFFNFMSFSPCRTKMPTASCDKLKLFFLEPACTSWLKTALLGLTISFLPIPAVDNVCLAGNVVFCHHYLMSLSLFCVPVQLPGGCSDESGPRRPADKRPHGLGVGPGQTEALYLPAAGPPQPTQQKGAAPDDDAAGSRQPLVLRLKRGAEESFPHRYRSIFVASPRMF